MRHSIASILIALSSFAAWAATTQSATLHMQNITCELCPVSVKKSL